MSQFDRLFRPGSSDYGRLQLSMSELKRVTDALESQGHVYLSVTDSLQSYSGLLLDPAPGGGGSVTIDNYQSTDDTFTFNNFVTVFYGSPTIPLAPYHPPGPRIPFTVPPNGRLDNFDIGRYAVPRLFPSNGGSISGFQPNGPPRNGQEVQLLNDGSGTPPVEAQMEGIVRQTWAGHPRTDLAFVYTVAETQTYTVDKKTYEGWAAIRTVHPDCVRQAPGVRDRKAREEVNV